MNHRRIVLVAALVLAGAGCAPESPTPTADTSGSEQKELAARRENIFGPEAAAPDIAWRPSGLGVKIVVPGSGTAPKMTDNVRVRYTGRLKDGTIFDKAHAGDKPADFQVTQLITGWAAAMPSLRPGGRAVFFIPPSLGYGGQRVGNIPPGSGLIFEVELLAVNP